MTDPSQDDRTARLPRDGTEPPPPAHGPVPYPPPPAAFPPPPVYSPPPTYSPASGGPYAYPAPPQSTTNTLAIVALVLAFVIPVAGAICGHMARRQIRETGQEGAGVAQAAIIISYAYIGLFLLGCCGFIVIAFASGGINT